MGFLIDMINVGEGDSFLLTLDHPQGGESYVLIDAGLPEKSDIVLEFLEKYAPHGLNLVIATHIDKDHIGGLKSVVENFHVEEFVLNVPPAFEKTWFCLRGQLNNFKFAKGADRLSAAIDTVNDLLSTLDKHRIQPTEALQGRYWNCGDVTLVVLNPTPERLADAWQESELLQTVKGPKPYLNALLGTVVQGSPTPQILPSLLGNSAIPYSSPKHSNLASLSALLGTVPTAKAEAPKTSPENDSSIVIELQYKGKPYALMTSDAGASVLEEVTGGKQYTFLKVPHHGSKTGLDEELIKRWRPSTAYIPVGENEHGHPALKILDMLKQYGVRTYCSTKTKDCRKQCRVGGFGTLCHRKDKAFHTGWTNVEAAKCSNNS